MTSRLGILCMAGLVLLVVAGCSQLVGTPSPSATPGETLAITVRVSTQAGTGLTATASATSIPLDTTTELPSIEATSETQSTKMAGETLPAVIESPTASPTTHAGSTPGEASTPTPRPTRTPTITPTPLIPKAKVQISDPGPMSKVVSPLHLTANFHTVPSGSYHVEIWAEPLAEGLEARLIYREVKDIVSYPVDWIYLDEEIPFELSRVSEFGQLRLSVFDSDGRAVWVNSVDLVLLSMGDSEITPGGMLSEPIILEQPTPNHLIQGGKMTISGLVVPGEKSMLISLTAVDGKVVAYSDVFVIPAEAGGYVPFSVEMPYQVEKSTWVRLSVSEQGVRIPGTEHLSSVEVYLSP